MNPSFRWPKMPESFGGSLVNGSFNNRTPSEFAQEHLVAPTVVTPTPEPSSLAILAVGLLSLAATAHPKRHKS